MTECDKKLVVLLKKKKEQKMPYLQSI